MELIKFLLILITINSCNSVQDKDLSIGAKIHVFLVKLIGKHEDIIKKEPKVEVTTYPRHYRLWHSTTERSTTSTVEYPYIIGVETPTLQKDGTIKVIPVPIEEPLNSAIVKLLETKELTKLPAGYFKIYIIPTTSTTDRSATTTEYENDSDYDDRKRVIRIFSKSIQKA